MIIGFKIYILTNLGTRKERRVASIDKRVRQDGLN